MGKTTELKVHMDFYLTMLPGESKEQATERFHKIMGELSETPTAHESAFQAYDFEIQEVE